MNKEIYREEMPALPKRIRPCCLPKYPQWMQYMVGGNYPTEHKHDKNDRRSSIPNNIGGRPPLPVSMREAELASRAAELSSSAFSMRQNADSNPLHNHPRNGRSYGGVKDSGSTMLLKQAIANRMASESELKNDYKANRMNYKAGHQQLGKQVGYNTTDKPISDAVGATISRQSDNETKDKEKSRIKRAIDDEMQRSIMLNSAWYRDDEGRTGYKPKDWADRKVPQRSQVKDLCGDTTKLPLNNTFSESKLVPNPLDCDSYSAKHTKATSSFLNETPHPDYAKPSVSHTDAKHDNLKDEAKVEIREVSPISGITMLDKVESPQRSIKNAGSLISDEETREKHARLKVDSSICLDKIPCEESSLDSISNNSPEGVSLSNKNSYASRIDELSLDVRKLSDESSGSSKLSGPQVKKSLAPESLRLSLQSHKSVTFSERVEVNEIDSNEDEQTDDGFVVENDKDKEDLNEYSPSISSLSDEYSAEDEQIPAGLTNSLNFMYEFSQNIRPITVDEYITLHEESDNETVLNQADVLHGSEELLLSVSSSCTDTLRNNPSDDSASSSNYSFKDILEKTDEHTVLESDDMKKQLNNIQDKYLSGMNNELETSYYDNVSEEFTRMDSAEVGSFLAESSRQAFRLKTVGVQTEFGRSDRSGLADEKCFKTEIADKTDRVEVGDTRRKEELLRERFLSEFANRVPKANLDSDGEEYPVDPNHQRKDSNASTISRESVISATSLRKEKLVSRNFTY